jgi:hypothetical protein
VNERDEEITRWISLDGAWFDVVSQTCGVGPSPAAGRRASTIREGFVSVDGAWFDLASGEWDPTPWPRAARAGTSVPEGFVSVDGALLPVERN